MTALRFVVILTEVKDLYEMIMNHMSDNLLIHSLMSLPHWEKHLLLISYCSAYMNILAGDTEIAPTARDVS